jgi:hypothetical protein
MLPTIVALEIDVLRDGNHDESWQFAAFLAPQITRNSKCIEYFKGEGAASKVAQGQVKLRLG